MFATTTRSPYRHLGITGACALLGLGLALASPASGQVKPSLDQKIRPYQLIGTMNGALSIAGSDTMKPLTEAWAADLRQLYPGLALMVESAGSETGLARLLEGQVQIAAMSRRITAPEIIEFKREFGYEPTEVPVAVDALAVFVHKDNPIEGLTLAELDAIFSKERRRGLKYHVNAWGDVMLEGEWAEAPIHLYGRNRQSGTTSFFKEHVLNGAEIKPAMSIMRVKTRKVFTGSSVRTRNGQVQVIALEHVSKRVVGRFEPRVL